MLNKEIREAAKKAGVHLWQVAEAYGMNDGNFSRKLRKELPQEEREKVLKIINYLSLFLSGLVRKREAYVLAYKLKPIAHDIA
jgi:hypothetical protein